MLYWIINLDEMNPGWRTTSEDLMPDYVAPPRAPRDRTNPPPFPPPDSGGRRRKSRKPRKSSNKKRKQRKTKRRRY